MGGKLELDRLGRVAVLGGGAIGQLYAGMLASVAPGKVTLITRRPEAQARIRAGLTISRPDGTILRPAGLEVRLAQEGRGEPGFDLVLVAVSACDTAAMAPLAARLLSAEGVCLTLQNGLNNQAALAQAAGARRVALGATSFVVHMEGVADVRLDGLGVTWIPVLPERLAWLHGWLAAAALNPKRVDNPLQLLWRKAAIGTNGYVSLVLGAPIGRVVRTASGRELAKLASLEVTKVACAAGIGLSEQDVVATLQVAWASCSEDARSSLYSDYLAGRRTELEERLGAILERARELGVPVPTLRGLYLLARARLELGRPAA